MKPNTTIVACKRINYENKILFHSNDFVSVQLQFKNTSPRKKF